jgi:SAM-dependent methyltransferase
MFTGLWVAVRQDGTIDDHKDLTIERRRVTRGSGALEAFLARQRSRQANRLIPDPLRSGRILDVGFGSFPLFLSETRFAERYGLDREVPAGLADHTDIHLIAHDLEHKRELPFESNFFTVVTMLAVFEHLDTPVLLDLLHEIKRVLVLGGVLVMTTPAGWTAGILKALSRMRLVSGDEVGEHRDQYSRAQIRDLLQRGGFESGTLEIGSFELGMNIWARASRS